MGPYIVMIAFVTVEFCCHAHAQVMMDLHDMTDAITVKMDAALDSIAVLAGGQTWPGGFMATRRNIDPAGRRARKARQQLQGKEAQNVARAGAKQCGAPYNQDGFVTKKAGMDYLLMGGAAGTLGLTWPEIEAGEDSQGGLQEGWHLSPGQGSRHHRWPWCASQCKDWPGLKHGWPRLSVDGRSSRDSQLDMAPDCGRRTEVQGERWGINPGRGTHWHCILRSACERRRPGLKHGWPRLSVDGRSSRDLRFDMVPD